jgi:hypothetical protein
MDHQSPWNLHNRPSRNEQEADFELGSFEGGLYNPNVPLGSRPTPAPGNVSGTDFSEPDSHGYYTGTTESAPFPAPSAFAPAYPAGFPMQSNSMLNNIWDPAGPSPPSQFHGYGWQASDMSSLSGSHSLVATQPAGALGPGHPVLRSSTGASNPIAMYLDQAFGMASGVAPAAPQQPHLQAASRSTSWPRAFWWRKLRDLKGPEPQDIESCWRCKIDHKKVRILADGCMLARFGAHVCIVRP